MGNNNRTCWHQLCHACWQRIARLCLGFLACATQIVCPVRWVKGLVLEHSKDTYQCKLALWSDSRTLQFKVESNTARWFGRNCCTQWDPVNLGDSNFAAHLRSSLNFVTKMIQLNGHHASNNFKTFWLKKLGLRCFKLRKLILSPFVALLPACPLYMCRFQRQFGLKASRQLPILSYKAVHIQQNYFKLKSRRLFVHTVTCAK